MCAAAAGPIFSAHCENRSDDHCSANRRCFSRHVLGHGGMSPGLTRTHMAGDALAAVEELDGVVGDPGVEFTPHEGVADGVVVALKLEVAGDCARRTFLKLGEHVGLGRQRTQRIGRSMDSKAVRREPGMRSETRLH